MKRVADDQWYMIGHRDGAAKVVAAVEKVLRKHGLVNTPEALGELRDSLDQFHVERDR